ncbi:hypothetical protein BC833DRAFT_612701 [Globomyces pollinis-pini]|nr:hypothetical protein BC833DRAFT_612701 [Globomyces pollinis-pini]
MSCSNPFAHRPVKWCDRTYSFKNRRDQLVDFLCAMMSAVAVASIYSAALSDYSNFKSDYLSLPLFAFLVFLPVAARLHTVWLVREKVLLVDILTTTILVIHTKRRKNYDVVYITMHCKYLAIWVPFSLYVIVLVNLKIIYQTK